MDEDETSSFVFFMNEIFEKRNRMTQVSFSQLLMKEEIKRAVEEMGFSLATEIQANSIPVIQQGFDVIGRSQTGTGKTVAFGIPALESIDPLQKNVQVLILCPTRELAVQACEEIQKLARFLPGIRAVDVYGGAPMDRQIARLRTANIVVGTPGRVMDHMRRRTLRLDGLKMIVLDEADEMLSMGFREDIETVLAETPEDRQTILFSATMPPEILALTRKYQREPKLIEVSRKQVTVENIEQSYYDVPMGRKMDALNLILQYYSPRRSMIFCNTKKMVEDVATYLHRYGFEADGLHGDMNQAQRTKVMNAFKQGKTAILVATDVAARGIDVNDIDYVINYDIPQNTEYYVHRIGRTGRAGKSGKALTICSGRRQVDVLLRIVRLVKATIKPEDVPAIAQIEEKKRADSILAIEEALKSATELAYADTVEQLTARGYDPATLAAVLMELHFGHQTCEIAEIKSAPRRNFDTSGNERGYRKVSINVGRANRVAPNHIVGAITERTDLRGKDIGKIEIYDNNTVVSIPENEFDQTLAQMQNMKVCGTATVTTAYKAREKSFDRGYGGKSRYEGNKDYRNLKKKRYGGEKPANRRYQ